MRNRSNRVLAVESSRSRLERWSFNGLIGLIGAIATLLLVAPTMIVLITSFTSAFSLKFPPPGYSLRWYRALINDSPEIVAAALTSLQVAATATASSTDMPVASEATFRLVSAAATISGESLINALYQRSE